MSGVQTIEIGEDDGEQRLDRWFRKRFPQVTQGHLQKLLRKGEIRVDGKRVDASDRLVAGQQVRVPPLPDAPDETPRPPKPIDQHLVADLKRRILFFDKDVLVFDKPAGLAVQGGSGTDKHLDGVLDAFIELGSSAVAKGNGERPKLVHRLDKDTSGVLLLARTTAAARSLTATFRTRAARKYYWGVTVGVPQPLQGRIDLPLAKMPSGYGEQVAVDNEDGVKAVTLYQVIENAHRRAAFVALWPQTGRTHQLRVHMAHLGWPILGDGKYAAQAAFLEGADLPRQLHLHARRLIVPHPSGRGKIDVTAQLPEHMRNTWEYFGFDRNDDGDPFSVIAEAH
jgi:23S rRNA pseudouridine955/2504/2580 synthase